MAEDEDDRDAGAEFPMHGIEIVDLDMIQYFFGWHRA